MHSHMHPYASICIMAALCVLRPFGWLEINVVICDHKHVVKQKVYLRDRGPINIEESWSRPFQCCRDSGEIIFARVRYTQL